MHKHCTCVEPLTSCKLVWHGSITVNAGSDDLILTSYSVLYTTAVYLVSQGGGGGGWTGKEYLTSNVLVNAG